MNSYLPSSGLQNSSEMSQNFEFSTPSTSKLGAENSAFSSISSLSKPRMVKSRKSSNSRSMGSLETRKIDLGSDRFRPVLDNVIEGSLRLDGNVSAGGGFRDQTSGLGIKTRHLKSNVKNKVEKVGDELTDEIRKLRLNNDSSSKGVDNGLPVDLTRLNLRDNDEAGGRSDGFVFGSSRTKINNVDPVVDSTLPDQIKNLKIGDHDRSHGMNADDSNQAFVSGSNEAVSSSSVVIDSMVLDEMEKLNIRDISDGSADNDNMSEPLTQGNQSCRQSSCIENISNAPQVSEHDKNSGLSGVSVLLNSDFSSGGFQFQCQVPCSDETEKREGFSFSGKQEGTRMPNVEFRTPEPKGMLFSGSNMNLEFGSTGSSKVTVSRGKKGKVKESNPVLVSLVKSLSAMETSMHHEPSESFSPMDVSPCETRYDAQSECMNINEDNNLPHDVNTGVDMANLEADCVSTTEDVSFKSAVEALDNDGESEVESKYKVESCDQTQYFSASSSISSGGSSFTFSASSPSRSQASSAMRNNIKRNQMKVGQDACISPRTTLMSDATSPLQFSRVPLLPSQVGQYDCVSSALREGGINTKIASPTSQREGINVFENFEKGITSQISVARAAREACEKWRLRGNQAYAHGDLNKAEDHYTQGLSCIPRHETSRECLQSLVLCYSNRAATRMSLGRMRAALGDCLVAAEIDPTFLRVQLRAANCYLALGEIGDASRYFKNLLQSTDASLERKIILEASAGLQKSKKLSEYMDQSTLLSRQRTLPDVERALEIIAEALIISPYSEILLEHKAEALSMLKRYEEVIQLCEHTLEAAENNSSISCANELLSNSDAKLLENYSFRTWRFGFIFKSNFYLGKLEEAFESLEKHEQWRSMLVKYGNEALESLIPQLSTARQLLQHKSAGNGAFQTGRHKEAVEHYTAALSFNVESRPFTAVCFGNRAAAFQALGQITDAVADCSLAMALDGNYLKAISRRATLFEMIRDYDQAAKDLQKFVSLLSKQAEAKPNPALQADLRQARQRLYQMEEYTKRGIPLNFYLILGVEQSVTASDLKKAYRKAALRHHPDKAVQSLARSECGDDGIWKEIAEEVYKDADKLFKMIGEAHAVLSVPTKRSQYDIEEEMRNGMKKTGNSTSRMPNDPSNYAEQRDSVRQQWREGRTPSSTNPFARGFEPTRPGRYY